MKKILSKEEILRFLDQSCNEVETEIDKISDDLYVGKTFTKEELLNKNYQLNSAYEAITEIVATMDYIFDREKNNTIFSKMTFNFASIINILLFILGNPILAIILEYLQFKLYKSSKYHAYETLNYLTSVSEKGLNLINRVSNYQDTINAKIKKNLEVKEELDKDEEKNAKFDAALSLTNYLLQGYELEEADEEIIAMVKEILKDGGAEGNSIEELISNMRNKLESLEGGKVLNKK